MPLGILPSAALNQARTCVGSCACLNAQRTNVAQKPSNVCKTRRAPTRGTGFGVDRSGQHIRIAGGLRLLIRYRREGSPHQLCKNFVVVRFAVSVEISTSLGARRLFPPQCTSDPCREHHHCRTLYDESYVAVDRIFPAGLCHRPVLCFSAMYSTHGAIPPPGKNGSRRTSAPYLERPSPERQYRSYKRRSLIDTVAFTWCRYSLHPFRISVLIPCFAVYIPQQSSPNSSSRSLPFYQATAWPLFEQKVSHEGCLSALQWGY